MAPLLLLLLLGAAPLLGGCVETERLPAAREVAPPGAPSARPAAPDAAMPGLAPEDVAEAERVFREAARATPDVVGLDARFTREGRDLLRLRGFVDDARQVASFRMLGDAAALGPLPREGPSAGMMDTLDALFRTGFDLYAGPEGSAYAADGLSRVYAPGARDGSLPPPAENPFMQMFLQLRPVEEMPEGVEQRIDRVTRVLHEGRPAWEVALRQTRDDQVAEGVAVALLDPPRLAQYRYRLLEGYQGLDGADMTLDLTYGEDVPEVPERVRRALGLRYETVTDRAAEMRRVTWTFQVDGGVPLDEVEVALKDRPEGDPVRIEDLPERWAMRLSEGRREDADARVVFTDHDGDGLVSRGDTLRVFTRLGAGDAPEPMLRDAKTGTHVVPAPPPALLVVMAALAALALARRRHPRP